MRCEKPEETWQVGKRGIRDEGRGFLFFFGVAAEVAEGGREVGVRASFRNESVLWEGYGGTMGDAHSNSSACHHSLHDFPICEPVCPREASGA
jgi:hypothetical protein